MNIRTGVLVSIAALAALCGCVEREPSKPQSVTPMAAAINIAVEAMEKDMTSEYVRKYKPYRAELLEGVWHVYGTAPGGGPGGTPEAKVRDADGVVLSVAHSQ